MIVKFIDLFAGIDGIRKGFENACKEMNLQAKCVFTSEIKPWAIDVLKQNHPNEIISGDITKIDSLNIPVFYGTECNFIILVFAYWYLRHKKTDYSARCGLTKYNIDIKILLNRYR